MGRLGFFLHRYSLFIAYSLKVQAALPLTVRVAHPISSFFLKCCADGLAHIFVLPNKDIQEKKLGSGDDSPQLSDNLDPYRNFYLTGVTNPLKAFKT